MGERLQRVERRINLDIHIRKLPLQGCGKTEEQWVTRSKNDYLVIHITILSIYIGKGHRDIYPLRPVGQYIAHYLMMTQATREHLTAIYYPLHFVSKGRLRIIVNSYYQKPKHQFIDPNTLLIQKSLPGFICSASSRVIMALHSVAAILLPPLRPSTIIFGTSEKLFTAYFDSLT